MCRGFYPFHTVMRGNHYSSTGQREFIELTNTNLQLASPGQQRSDDGIVPKGPDWTTFAFILQSDTSDHVQYYPSNVLR
jgi:hypothetical protein